MAHKFSVLYILFGTLQAVTGIFDTSNYQVVTDSRNQGFSYYAEQCNNIGDGWAPLILEDYAQEKYEKYEYHLVRRVIDGCCQYYWIGGSTNSTRYETLQYTPDYSGVNRVKLWPCCSPSLGDPSYLSTGHEGGKPINYIICEKNSEMVNDGHEFTSPHSNYKLLVHPHTQNYTNWRSWCNTELGDAWAPAVLNSKQELAFISKFHKIISEEYWIGGSTNMTSGMNIKYSQYYSNRSGECNVFINKEFKLKSSLSSTSVSSILCEKENIVHTGLELASTRSKYRELVLNSEFAMNFKQWKFWCSKIGTGWAPAVLNTKEELYFLREGQKSFSSSAPYLIGGSTDQTDSFPYNSYRKNNTGKHGVYVSTVSPLRSPFLGVHWLDFYDKERFDLTAQPHNFTAASILCEQEMTSGDEFSSATSQYKKIVKGANNYTYYVSKCTELGVGWAPAVLNTKVEHDFIRESQRGLTNAEDYFITGSVFPEKTGTFYYGLRPHDLVSVMPPGYSPIQSENPVYVSTLNPNTGVHSNYWFVLTYSSHPNTTKPGILCEKAKL